MRDKSRVDYSFVRRFLLALGKEISFAIEHSTTRDSRDRLDIPIPVGLDVTVGQLERVREVVNILLEMVEEEYMEDNRGISWRDWVKEQPGWEKVEV